MNRFDRTVAILIQLQSRRVVRAQDIADRFGISLRTVYRDIRTLEQAGVPIAGEAGVGYTIVEGYRLPPIMITREEAFAFLTAEKLIEKIADTATQELYKSAMLKIKSVLRSKEKDELSDLDQYIDVTKYSSLTQPLPQSNLLPTIYTSLTERRVLSISYHGEKDQATQQRDIEPIGVTFIEEHWYLIAYCRLRTDYRTFRIDRVTKAKLTDQIYTPDHPSLQTYLQNISHRRDVQPALVSFRQDIARYTYRNKFYHGFVKEEVVDGWVQMTFLTSSLIGLASWLMAYTDRVIVHSPPQLRHQLQRLATTLYNHYQDPTDLSPQDPNACPINNP